MVTLSEDKLRLQQDLSVAIFTDKVSKAACLKLPKELISINELMSGWHYGGPGWAFAPPI